MHGRSFIAGFNMQIITSLLLVCYCLSSFGETNAPLASPQLFSLPGIQLRLPFAESKEGVQRLTTNLDEELTSETVPKSEEASPSLAAESTPGDSPEPKTLTNEELLMLGYYERLERGGFLTPPTRPPENLYTRTVNAIFQPEVMHVGKTFVSFSPITAIKRKNPLALLNPIVLNIAW